MADQILEQVREAVEGQIDFKGQHLAEFSGTTLLSIVGVRIIFHMRHLEVLTAIQAISFLVGYSRQDIKLALALGLIGTVITFLIVVPPWPFFKTHPVKWLPIGGVERSAGGGITVDGQVIG
jgi:signal peptidase complex subunit 1